jgi:DNA-binding beta-propeller fold protein YncE
VVNQGIYFANEDDAGELAINYYDVATRGVTRLTTLDKMKWTFLAPTGFAVSPDGQTILYVQQDSNESDLILVENFR